MDLRPDLPREGADFAVGVAHAAPSLRPVVDEHMQDHPELLPHVLFGQVTECANFLARRDDRQAADELASLLAFLEEGLAGEHPYVIELVRDSFIENAQPPSEYGELRRKIMERPLLRQAYTEVVGAGFW